MAQGCASVFPLLFTLLNTTFALFASSCPRSFLIVTLPVIVIGAGFGHESASSDAAALFAAGEIVELTISVTVPARTAVKSDGVSLEPSILESRNRPAFTSREKRNSRDSSRTATSTALREN